MPMPPVAQDNADLAQANYETAQAALQLFEPALDIAGHRILDAGCGLGGRTLYYAEQRARRVVGLDASPERAGVAAALASRHAAGANVRIVVGDAARLPFRAEAFDGVVSTDSWEHLQSPTLALRECARVVRHGGTVAISAISYYSPWGAHAWNWLPLPWIQVILPRRCLFRLIAWIERRRQINARLPSVARLDWSRPDDPAHARHLTVASMVHALSASNMTTIRFTVIPVGTRYGGILAKVTQALIGLPLLRELLAGMMVIVMQKP